VLREHNAEDVEVQPLTNIRLQDCLWSTEGNRCMKSHPSDVFRPPSADREQAPTQRPLPLTDRMKARQSCKIRELAEAVKSAGFLTLDEQANALGLPRSTAWTIRRASHKASGVSASIINRMLAAPELPPLARTKILEYVEEKAAGLYGGSRSQRRKFGYGGSRSQRRKFGARLLIENSRRAGKPNPL
jgi:hypothetical protein